MKSSQSAGWHVAGASVRGAIHARRGAPNQDAIAWYAPADAARPRIIALADGHGASLHIRSHRGARFAVRVAVEALRRIAEEDLGDSTPVLGQYATNHLPTEIASGWQTLVEGDLAIRPLAGPELDALMDRVPAASLARLERQPSIAYGSTLLAALLAPDYVLVLQLGDGDILEVDEAGEVRRTPLAADPLLHGNETTSLCSPDAKEHMRVVVESIDAHGPNCFMLSTDGYSNSFLDTHGLEQAAADLYAIAGDMGMRELGRALPDWLRATSAQGSGDDISVGLAIREPAA